MLANNVSLAERNLISTRDEHGSDGGVAVRTLRQTAELDILAGNELHTIWLYDDEVFGIGFIIQ